ncbi:MAG: nitrilase family protein [Chitinophagales bacterium]
MSTLTVSGIQSDLIWEDKAANLRKLGDQIVSLKDKTELIILPEMFSTGFVVEPAGLAEKMDGPSLDWMKKLSNENRVILTGSLIIEDGGKYHNRLIWMMPNGQYGYYDKRHLFAFAGEDERYSAGNKRLIASVKGWKINLLVCYDLRFPVWARQGTAPENAESSSDLEYDLLIYVANWPSKRIHAWKILLMARAIENQAYVVGVNRVGTDGFQNYHTGDSMVIDPFGQSIYHAPEKEDLFTCTLDKNKLVEARSKFPFWKDRDHFLIEP